MPKLPYQQIELGTLPSIGGRRATASDFGAGVGAELSRAGQVGKQVYEDIGDSEARKIVVGRAQVVTKYAQRLDEAATTGEDLTKIKDEMNAELAKFGENVATRKGQDTLDLATAETNKMFDQQANAIAVRRAGADAKLQAGNLLRSLSGTLATRPDALKFALGQTDAFAETLTLVPPEKRAEIRDMLRSELHATAAMASARLVPEQTKEQLAANKWELTGDQALQVQAEADRTIRARRVDAEYQHTLSERRKDEANDKARQDLYKGLRAGTTTERDILMNGDLKPATQEHLINVMEQMAKEARTTAARTDPAVFNQLRAMIDAAPGTDSRIVDPQRVWALYGKGLSQDDATFLENRIYANRGEAGYTLAQEVDGVLRALKGQLDKSSLLTIDPMGGERYARFTRYVYDQVEKARKDPAADPRELLNPKSPKYVGNAIPSFLSGAQQLQRETADRIDKALRPKDRKPLKDILGE